MAKKPSKIENESQPSLCLQTWLQQNLRISTNHKYRIYVDVLTWCFVNLTFCKPDTSDVLKPDVLKPDVLKADILWVYRLKVEYLSRIEYDFQKSRVTDPWDHKVSVSAKKVKKKKFHACVPLIWVRILALPSSLPTSIRCYINTIMLIILVAF
jgi:hypothetical protein